MKLNMMCYVYNFVSFVRFDMTLRYIHTNLPSKKLKNQKNNLLPFMHIYKRKWELSITHNHFVWIIAQCGKWTKLFKFSDSDQEHWFFLSSPSVTVIEQIWSRCKNIRRISFSYQKHFNICRRSCYQNKHVLFSL